MASLVKTGRYGAINALDTTATGYYDVKYLSNAFKLQEDINTHGHTVKNGELVVKSEQLSIMKKQKMRLPTKK